MISIKYICCVLLLVLVVSDFSDANMRICGQSLNQFLEMVCVDGFNSKNLRAKKSVPLVGSDRENYWSLFFDNKLNSEYNNLMAKTRRRRHDGVADECCRKPCAMSELLSYCL